MGTIAIGYLEAILNDNTSSIMVTNGTFALDSNDPLQMYGATGFSSLWITSDTINFNVDAPSESEVNVTVEVGLAASGDGDPVIEVTSFVGTAGVTWPTAAGQQQQELIPGQAVTLGGYTP